jgi:alpha-beta hydrolase superfamily lysophospholipase
MRTDFYFPSEGTGQIHACRWMPEKTPIAVLQIVHGIAEYIERYDDFANYMNQLGYIVVAEDHMGHGKSINGGGIQGYFHGGWFAAVADSNSLLERTKQEFPGLPYVILGHSMGSFMTRTLLCAYPNSGISTAVICGTGWQPRALLAGGIAVCETVCKAKGETTVSETLQNLVFSGYNKRVENPATPFDWVCADKNVVSSYIADPLCGFTATCGLLRDMLKGIAYIENPANLAAMYKNLPVFFIAGGDDPVGNYGAGVHRSAQAFEKIGMRDVTCKIYPGKRHEILNETGKCEVYHDISAWLDGRLFSKGGTPHNESDASANCTLRQ